MQHSPKEEKWRRQLAAPRTALYWAGILFIITLIYTVDEIASQIGMLMKTEIANDLFARFGSSSVGALEILGAIGMPFQLLGLLYRPLADKFGRKPFLVINTFGMSLALLMIFLSRSVGVYFAGACLVQFFIPHDMHVVYIMETAPQKHRATVYSSVKFIATLGVLLVPLLRKLLMAHAGQWRNVYFLPALVGLVASGAALLFARETEPFIRSRLEGTSEAKKESGGNVFAALKYAMKDPQLRWLYITAAAANIGFIGTVSYQVILSYGFARGQYGAYTDQVMNAVSLGPVTQALMLFPVGCAFSQLVMGFVSDRKGRKAAAILVAVNSLLGFLGFYFGALLGMAPSAVGLLCGISIGSYYSLNDVIIMMVGESSPTHLRSSAMSAQFIVTALGGVVSYAVGLPVLGIFGNQAMGPLSFCLLVPGFVLALILLCRYTRDTRGTDLEAV